MQSVPSDSSCMTFCTLYDSKMPATIQLLEAWSCVAISVPRHSEFPDNHLAGFGIKMTCSVSSRMQTYDRPVTIIGHRLCYVSDWFQENSCLAQLLEVNRPACGTPCNTRSEPALTQSIFANRLFGADTQTVNRTCLLQHLVNNSIDGMNRCGSTRPAAVAPLHQILQSVNVL